MQDPAGGQPSFTAVAIHNRGLVAMLNLAFEHPWVGAKPLETLPRGAVTGSRATRNLSGSTTSIHAGRSRARSLDLGNLCSSFSWLTSFRPRAGLRGEHIRL
jgi:hypothetical protein